MDSVAQQQKAESQNGQRHDRRNTNALHQGIGQGKERAGQKLKHNPVVEY